MRLTSYLNALFNGLKVKRSKINTEVFGFAPSHIRIFVTACPRSVVQFYTYYRKNKNGSELLVK